MILSYTLPGAEDKITAGIKIHTLRSDRVNRWKPGYLIHHATGVRSAAYDCFFQSRVVSVQQILLVLLDTGEVRATVDRRRLTDAQVYQLAINDGFDGIPALKKWFFKDGVTMWAGKIIGWTSFKY